MNFGLSYETSFCSQYESFLHECENAQRNWSEWREEMNALGAPRLNKEVSDELLRLQAKFAKAYARLQKHNHECELCRFVAKLSEQAGHKDQDQVVCVPENAEHTWQV